MLDGSLPYQAKEGGSLRPTLQLLLPGLAEIAQKLPKASAPEPAVPEIVRLSERGDVDGVRRLLKAGRDPSARDGFGFTALHGASKKGHLEVVKLLLAWKADVHATTKHQESPLHYACKCGREAIARALLGGGASAQAVSLANATPIELARSRNHSNLVELLGAA